jgi:hypothetical protein
VSTSIFGRIVSGADVEDWTMALLQRWFSTYLAELERQHGVAEGSWQRPRSFVLAPSLDKWPEDQLPAVLLVSVGLEPKPPMGGDGRYRVRFTLGAACVCSARTQAESHRMSQIYVAALRALLVQRPSLDGHADGVDLLDENYDWLEYDDIRTLASGQVIFTVSPLKVTKVARSIGCSSPCSMWAAATAGKYVPVLFGVAASRTAIGSPRFIFCALPQCITRSRSTRRSGWSSFVS